MSSVRDHYSPSPCCCGAEKKRERAEGNLKGMTARYTNAEWTRFLSEVEKGLKVSEEPCPCPDVGSPALAKTIDHTLLKLDVRPIQFDELCSEARVDGFAVRERTPCDTCRSGH